MEILPPLEPPPVPKKPRRFLILGGILVAVLVVAAVSVYTWYAVYGPCGRGTVDTASAALIDQLKAFEADFQLAASMNPIGLIGPVTHMEQTLWDTREVVVPACLQIARMNWRAPSNLKSEPTWRSCHRNRTKRLRN